MAALIMTFLERLHSAVNSAQCTKAVESERCVMRITILYVTARRRRFSAAECAHVLKATESLRLTIIRITLLALPASWRLCSHSTQYSSQRSKAPASTRCCILSTTRFTSILLRFSSSHSPFHVSNACAMVWFCRRRMICSALASAFSRAPASATKSNHVSKAPASTRCFIFPTTRATSILLRFSSAHSSRHVSNAIAMSRFLSLRMICSALANAWARFSASATKSSHW